MSYRIITDATADLNAEIMRGLPEVTMLPMNITVGTQSYVYGDGGNITVDEFYAAQNAGNFATTSQINPAVYEKYFKEILEAGEDILYLGFSSGLSNSIQNARLCADELAGQYPDRKIICLDTLCASVGEGFLVREAMRKKQEGMALEELAEWVQARRLSVCHWFTVDTFEHLRHGGRVSAAAAAVGTVLGIKPLLRVDEEGRLQVMGKPRGRKQALKAQLEKIRQDWNPQESPFMVIGQGDAEERAREFEKIIHENWPQAEVRIAPIGPVIGSHTGPGMLAIIFWGGKR